jgi:hypothetical protein
VFSSYVLAAVGGSEQADRVTECAGHVRSIGKRMDTGPVMPLHRLNLFLFGPHLLPHLCSHPMQVVTPLSPSFNVLLVYCSTKKEEHEPTSQNKQAPLSHLSVIGLSTRRRMETCQMSIGVVVPA